MLRANRHYCSVVYYYAKYNCAQITAILLLVALIGYTICAQMFEIVAALAAVIAAIISTMKRPSVLRLEGIEVQTFERSARVVVPVVNHGPKMVNLATCTLTSFEIMGDQYELFVMHAEQLRKYMHGSIYELQIEKWQQKVVYEAKSNVPLDKEFHKLAPPEQYF